MATAEEYRNNMLADVSDAYDKTDGSFIYDAIAPVAIQLVTIDASIVNVQSKLSINNLTGDDLATRINERTGITRKPAITATGSITAIGNGVITIGDLFETVDSIQFTATETKTITSSGNVNVKAVIAGASGNVPANQITLIPVTIAGITSVNNPSPTIDGFEAESDADLLIRYYERIQTPPTSGNKAEYKSWAKSVSGVGDAKIFPLFNGDNTVKVVLIDSNKQPSSAQVVTDVQNYIDPIATTGLGDGVAPIGAKVTVTSATGLVINVSVTITLSNGYTQQQADDNITASLTKYLKDIAFVESIVSYQKVGAKILDSNGVEDYSGLMINGGTTNITIGNEEVAILGGVMS